MRVFYATFLKKLLSLFKGYKLLRLIDYNMLINLRLDDAPFRLPLSESLMVELCKHAKIVIHNTHTYVQYFIALL